MSIEELLDWDIDKLEALTDEQLRSYFAPYLNVTRPELAPKLEESSGSKTKYGELTTQGQGNSSKIKDGMKKLSPEKQAIMAALLVDAGLIKGKNTK